MSKIILDPELKARLNGLNQQVEFCEADGRTVGHFVPEEIFQKLLHAALVTSCPHSLEELEQRRKTGGGMKLADFWNTLGVS